MDELYLIELQTPADTWILLRGQFYIGRITNSVPPPTRCEQQRYSQEPRFQPAPSTRRGCASAPASQQPTRGAHQRLPRLCGGGQSAGGASKTQGTTEDTWQSRSGFSLVQDQYGGGESVRARPLNQGFQRPPLHVQADHPFLILDLHGRHRLFMLCLHCRHGFFVAPHEFSCPRPALRAHEQQPAGDHQGLQNAPRNLPVSHLNGCAADVQSSPVGFQCREANFQQAFCTARTVCCTAKSLPE